MQKTDQEELFHQAVKAGLIEDPRWLELLEEPMPVWAVLELALRLVEKLDPPRNSYD